MKHKTIIVTLSALLAGGLGLFAQDNPPTVDTGNSVAAIAASDVPVPAEPLAAPADAPMAPPADATVAAPADTAAAAAPEEPAAAVETASTDPATGAGATAESPGAETVMPLIEMDDVQLTVAIKNLARQANLNYMLDPRVTFGQPGPNGAPGPQPTVSIRWENVTAQQALYALLNNHSLQLVEDTKTGISRITIKDPKAPDPLMTKIIRLNYASPSNIVTAVQAVFTDKTRSQVMGDVRTSQLVVLATEKELEAIDELVLRLDTPTQQVLIEARLLETAMNPKTIKGIDWSGTLEAQNVAFGNNLQSKPVEDKESDNRPLATQWPKLMLDTAKGFNPATAFLDADGVSAVISFINQSSEARVISAPRTVTLDNETATIEVTRASPIINVQASTANTTGGSQLTYTNLGVILKVTPRISANNFVNLKVSPEVSRVFGTVNKIIDGRLFQADEYDLRKLDTQVMIPSAHTLVLGGLVQDDERSGQTKVPLLGDIPGLGAAFRSKSKSRQKSNLVMFITPTIVQDSDYRPTQTDFLKSSMEMPAQAEWTAWDSAKPKDWSKPDYDETAVAAETTAVN